MKWVALVLLLSYFSIGCSDGTGGRETPFKQQRNDPLETKVQQEPARQASIPEISWDKADDYIGKTVLVRGTVVSTHDSGKATFLNFSEDWRGEFTGVIFSSLRDEFPVPPADLFLGREVLIQGKVKEYKDSSEILIEKRNQIRFADDIRTGIDQLGKDYSVTVFGGAEQVSGSLSILESDLGSWMVDCGLYYPDGPGDGEERNRNAQRDSLQLPEKSISVDAVFLTHAHLDHIGRLPLLVEKGYSGPIYATKLTLALAAPMLKMQLRYNQDPNRTWVWSGAATKKDYRTLHWEPMCKWAKGISSRNKHVQKGSLESVSEAVLPKSSSPCKTCGDLALNPISNKFREVELGDWIPLRGGVRVKSIDAGHIPGSTSWLFELRNGDETKTILFSGDIGNPHSTLLKGPAPIPVVDYLFVETTYGCKTLRVDPNEELRKFRDKLGKVVGDGGVAWIPAFALDRTQKVLHQIRIAQLEGTISKDIPILCPSPTAEAVTRAYLANLDYDGFRKSWSSDLMNVYPESFSRDYIEQVPSPSIILTTSGMMERAFSEGLLDKLLPLEMVTVFLVGYQDPNSPGGALKSGARELVLPSGERVLVKASVEFVAGLSSHGKANDMDVWMENQEKKSTKVFLVHGDEDALANRKECLLDQEWTSVSIPKRGAAIPIPLSVPLPE